MTTHLHREIDRLKTRLLALGGLVEDSLWKAVQAVNTRDEALALAVVEADKEIDRQEVELEEDCLKALALHQPVATDLRFIVAVLKINNDLERIGDQSANIANRAKYLARHAPVDAPFDLPGMARKVQAMLHDSLNALINMDATAARGICVADDEIDAMHRQTYGMVRAEIRRHPEQLDALTHILSISNHLERVADHATNIAEDVIYMVEGQIMRHLTVD
jgi:phosphate transport system protein